MKYTTNISLFLLMLVQYLVKNGPVVLEKKKKKNSGDLKITFGNFFYYLISNIHIALQIMKSQKAQCQKMLLSVMGRCLVKYLRTCFHY